MCDILYVNEPVHAQAEYTCIFLFAQAFYMHTYRTSMHVLINETPTQGQI